MLVVCPHCGESVIIQILACGIFRHGVYKDTFTGLPPHSTKEVCDKSVSEGLIYGCGRPFRVSRDGTVSVCDYV